MIGSCSKTHGPDARNLRDAYDALLWLMDVEYLDGGPELPFRVLGFRVLRTRAEALLSALETAQEHAPGSRQRPLDRSASNRTDASPRAISAEDVDLVVAALVEAVVYMPDDIYECVVSRTRLDYVESIRTFVGGGDPEVTAARRRP